MITLATDIGGTKISAALISDDGSFLLEKQMSAPHERCPGEITRALHLLVFEMKGTAKRFAVTSTGITNSGVLATLNPDNLGGLKEYPLKNIMEGITDLNGSVINDAQTAAWAEYTVLPKKICDMVFITASTGVGGGIIVNRKLLTGVSGLAEHVGHILSRVTGTERGRGHRGCVEVVSSGRAIMGAARNKLAGYNTKYIFKLARQEYKEAEFLAERSVGTIAELVVSLKLLLSCQIVVVGGSVGLVDGYVQKVSKHLSIYSETCSVMLFPAYFRSDSGLIGVAPWDRDCIT